MFMRKEFPTFRIVTSPTFSRLSMPVIIAGGKEAEGV